MARSEDPRAATARLDNERLNRREMQAGAAVLASRPTKAWLSITGKCNLLCSHCPRSLVEEQYLSSEEMTGEVFDRVKAALFPYLTLLRIGGNNLGEMLFAKSWNRYAAAINQETFTPWLITNAQTLNKARISELVEAGYIIDISIDAATEERYRQIRGASLARLAAHVREMVAAREAHRRAAPDARAARIIFSFTAFADNIDELPGLVRLGAELGVDEVVATHYMPSLEGQRYQSLFYHQRMANRAFDEARAAARETGIGLQVPPNYLLKPIGHEETLRAAVKQRYAGQSQAGSKAEGIPPCAHPWTSVSINEKGEVYPCCQSNLLMGDLRKSSFEEIWNNRRYRKLRQTVNTKDALPDCRQCVLRGATFTSVDCAEGSFFLRNLDLPNWHTDPFRARLRGWLARSRAGRRLWGVARSVYKNFLEWHFAR
jgi:radical SAM protein with 4Fe4S-binding SPASM domain